jgi:hydrogenase maturation protease
MANEDVSLPKEQRRGTSPSVRKTNTVLVIGIGNEYRSDDGLGICVARELRRRFPRDIGIAELSGEGTSLMTAWAGAAHVFIIDAISSGEPAGQVHRLNAMTEAIPRRFFNSSSHTFGVAEAIDLAKQLDQLPESLVLYGIEADSFESGMGLSESVVRSLPDLLHLIEHDIDALLQKRTTA